MLAVLRSSEHHTPEQILSRWNPVARAGRVTIFSAPYVRVSWLNFGEWPSDTADVIALMFLVILEGTPLYFQC